MNIGVLRSRVRSKGAQALPKFTNFLKFLMLYPKARKPTLNSRSTLSTLNSLTSLQKNATHSGGVICCMSFGLCLLCHPHADVLGNTAQEAVDSLGCGPGVVG